MRPLQSDDIRDEMYRDTIVPKTYKLLYKEKLIDNSITKSKIIKLVKEWGTYSEYNYEYTWNWKEDIREYGFEVEEICSNLHQ